MIKISAGVPILDNAEQRNNEFAKGTAFFLMPDGTYSVGTVATAFCENVIIPCSYRGRAVTGIDGGYSGFSGFAGSTLLKSVFIPNSVKRIGDYAFEGCLNLKKIKYGGTKAQWQETFKGDGWNFNVPSDCIVCCVDGEINI